ncbi:MAG: D-alanyl-D-alanine carboxypeptidase [Syntrophomonadaceae bacterium]|nr:D-alanyl-D-alanine carboxypeptidase [Syntrophomonadaceae bacterium]
MARRKHLIWTLLLVFVLVIGVPGAVQADDLELTAEAYILMDADSGKVLLAHNEHKRLPPASMTKLMTMTLAAKDLEKEKFALTDKVQASEEACKMGGSQIYLEPGEKMTAEDLLISIAVGSANDASVAMAEHLDGSHKDFVRRMNYEAKHMGLKDTNFVNAYGLPDPNHYSSAYDMAIIARHALKHPKLLELSSIKEYNLREGKFKLYNTNKLLWWYQGADGFKTGWTNEAKHCLTATAKRDGLRLIAVVMAAPENHGNFREAMKLFNYGFARYTYKNVSAANSVCGVISVGKGTVNKVQAVAEEDVGTIVPKGEDKKIKASKSLFTYIDAPVVKGQKLGEYVVYKDGQLAKQVNLVASEDVPRASLMKEILKVFAETYLI